MLSSSCETRLVLSGNHGGPAPLWAEERVRAMLRRGTRPLQQQFRRRLSTACECRRESPTDSNLFPVTPSWSLAAFPLLPLPPARGSRLRQAFVKFREGRRRSG